MFPAKGSLLIMDYRINQLVLNRCRKPADADILVPGDTISLIGTTSSRIDYNKIDQLTVEPDEVEVLLREGIKLAPIMARTRLLRAYAGVRPLVAVDGDESGRNISRGIVLLDHAERDGLKGFNTITGGKLTTYRKMAQHAVDAALGVMDRAGGGFHDAGFSVQTIPGVRRGGRGGILTPPNPVLDSISR